MCQSLVRDVRNKLPDQVRIVCAITRQHDNDDDDHINRHQPNNNGDYTNNEYTHDTDNRNPEPREHYSDDTYDCNDSNDSHNDVHCDYNYENGCNKQRYKRHRDTRYNNASCLLYGS